MIPGSFAISAHSLANSPTIASAAGPFFSSQSSLANRISSLAAVSTLGSTWKRLPPRDSRSFMLGRSTMVALICPFSMATTRFSEPGM
jgi:hypothetical protein